MHYMAQQFVEQLEKMSELDFSKTPNMQAAARIRDELVKEIDVETAEQVVAAMTIRISSEHSDDEFIEKISVLYAKLILKLYAGYVTAGFKNPDMTLIASARSLSLTFE